MQTVMKRVRNISNDKVYRVPEIVAAVMVNSREDAKDYGPLDQDSYWVYVYATREEWKADGRNMKGPSK